MQRRNICTYLSVTLLFLLFMLSCDAPIPPKKLVKTDFQLISPDSLPIDFEQQVVDFEIDAFGNFYVVDALNLLALKYGPDGKYVKDFLGRGGGNYEKMVGIETIDSSVVLHTLGRLSFHLPDGRHLKTISSEGVCDLKASNTGLILLNSSTFAGVLGNVLHLYNKDMKLLTEFHSARAEFEENSFLDFGFADFLSDSTVAYLQTYSDSAFVYDIHGTLKISRKLSTTSEPYTVVEGGQPVYFEDIAVSNDGIYVLRLDVEKTTDELVFINKIDKYDFNLNLVDVFELPESITLTTSLSPWALCYRKFQVFEDKFYFYVSQPQEHLEVFAVE